MNLEQAQAEFKAATEAYAAAKRGTANQRFAAQHGMSNSLAFCEMVECTAYHNWLRAHEKVVALEPEPTPKPTIAPKPAPAPVKASTTAAAPRLIVYGEGEAEPLTCDTPSDLLLYLQDRGERDQARMRSMLGLPPLPRS